MCFLILFFFLPYLLQLFGSMFFFAVMLQKFFMDYEKPDFPSALGWVDADLIFILGENFSYNCLIIIV